MTTQRLKKHITPQSKIGDIGEALVAKVMGCTVSDNPYDTTKDMVQNITGLTVEVKTQLRFWMKDSFTIHISQLPKCTNVDKLVFVDYGLSGHCRLYLCNNRTNYTLYNYDTMAAFPVADMVLTADFETPRALKMCKLTETKYKSSLNDSRLYENKRT
ncbi:hypothetical protein CMI47_20570 [Candidatus Pacearchaeota archaeon]|nr:hypothetical protein [Candidatus Pacearchaeota archaeon]|tara:strand:- start:3779 stop:4252 length:474 start_codon:yes stop_codon:yes gene_type:complete